jgi:hypothetical protein
VPYDEEAVGAASSNRRTIGCAISQVLELNLDLRIFLFDMNGFFRTMIAPH